MLLAMLTLGMATGTTLVSCKDDELTEEEKQQKQEQEDDAQFLLTSEFWQVVGQLSTAEVLPDDWQNTTFEPGVGEASDKSTTTRIVLTNEAKAAAESFEHLTGVDVTNLMAYEWKRDFGTLTYQRLTDGTGWAAVDVDIKQMPGLKRIVYCTPEQQGLNANVPGVPYYRFGDVIKKKNANGAWEYWVCVRPCFGYEKKGDMHWMCLGSLPDNYIEAYTYKDRTWYRHKSLTTNDEHIKNLSEMTFAILNPTEWADYYDDNPDEYLFHDFSTANIKYHNRYFWQMVQNAWNQKIESEGGRTVWELLFHRTMNEVKADGQLNYFYGSASGPNWHSWYMKMQTASVNLRATDPDKLFFRELVKKTHNKSCENLEFNIKEYSDWGHPDASTYFDKNFYIYPLRYATGKTLFGSQPNYYQSMGGSNDIQDVYVFNEHYYQNRGSKAEMKVFKQADVDNAKATTWGFFHPGTVIKDEDDNLWMCYLNWCDQEMGEEYTFHTDHKVRFISFDAVKGKKEDIEYAENYAESHPDWTSGVFAVNLVPEDQAYIVAWCLEEMAAPCSSHGQYMRNSMKDVLGVNPDDLVLLRDSVLDDNGNKVKSKIYATNVAYIPAEGRRQGFQPMLRYVNDGTRTAANRDDSNDPYWYNWYYTKYTDENVPYKMLNRTIDVTDTYKWGNSLEDDDVLADRWSACPWNANNIPMKFYDHTYLHTKPYDFRDYTYDTEAHKWSRNLLGNDMPTAYTPSVYWEPIVMVAYLEIDDDDRMAFKGTYGGKKYTLVSDPLPDAIKQTTFSYWFHLRDVVDKYTFVNEERKNGLIYKW